MYHRGPVIRQLNGIRVRQAVKQLRVRENVWDRHSTRPARLSKWLLLLHPT